MAIIIDWNHLLNETGEPPVGLIRDAETAFSLLGHKFGKWVVLNNNLRRDIELPTSLQCTYCGASLFINWEFCRLVINKPARDDARCTIPPPDTRLLGSRAMIL
jgi:hypothetical protein